MSEVLVLKVLIKSGVDEIVKIPVEDGGTALALWTELRQLFVKLGDFHHDTFWINMADVSCIRRLEFRRLEY